MKSLLIVKLKILKLAAASLLIFKFSFKKYSTLKLVKICIYKERDEGYS